MINERLISKRLHTSIHIPTQFKNTPLSKRIIFFWGFVCPSKYWNQRTAQSSVGATHSYQARRGVLNDIWSCGAQNEGGCWSRSCPDSFPPALTFNVNNKHCKRIEYPASPNETGRRPPVCLMIKEYSAFPMLGY